MKWLCVAVLLVEHAACLAAQEWSEAFHLNNVSNDSVHVHEHHGIHVANWRWDEIGVFFTFTIFIVLSGLAKVAFHHAGTISEHIPESCLMIIVGVTVGGIIYACGVSPSKEDAPPDGEDRLTFPTFTPRLFFLILLPPVVLESAYSLYNRAFSYNVCTIMLYAVVGTLFNTFTIGPLLFLIWWLGLMGPMLTPPSMTECLVFSALISAVDPVAVLAIFQEVGVNQDLYYLVFGESLFNDAVTVVLYTTMVTFCEMPVIAGEQYGLAVVAFFTVSCGGIIVGALFGLLTALITKTTQECRVVEPLAVLGIAYLSYLAAELFHFSGIISIIACGLVQAHYALKNISQKSYTTVKYFTKMISSTSDAIIFLFLGMVLVSDSHVWHTGFVLWTLVLCLVCRFLGVFLLTWLANQLRVKKINLQEQFIMAYGGLRGAVAFSMVEMLEEDTVQPRSLFVTCTLVVILFTVFIQGSTIKPLVSLLHIARSKTGATTLNDEIGNNVICTMMAGIEEISGVRGDFYIRRKLEQLDNSFLKKIFLWEGPENDLTRLYQKLCLTEHFAHLYGPVTLVEDKKALLLHEDGGDESIHHRVSSIFPGVELRRRTASDDGKRVTPGALRRAFSSNAYQKFHQRYNPNLIDDHCQELREQLKLRHLKAFRMTSMAAMTQPRRQSADMVLPEEFARPRRQIHSELEGLYSRELEGIDAILDRTEQRIKRKCSVSSAGNSTPLQAASPTSTGAEPTWPVMTPLRRQTSQQHEQTLQNIAETDDVFLDANSDSPV
ncbi:Na(+)/H(+) exchanger beta-like isoform X1 [Periplaneta americana]|uniref:Na(+)/H(+) exchanger beta-like isoform X1 n=1 Tax=Periplaneta americana TaxID=6978 RepID=UPI0037E8EA0C